MSKKICKYSETYKTLYDIFNNEFKYPLFPLENIKLNDFFQPYSLANKSIREQLNKYDVKKILPIMIRINARLKYISSGSTGHFFKGILLNSDTASINDVNNIKARFALKMTPYQKNSNYKSIYEITRPENAELNMLKALSYFVLTGQTTHLLLPIHSCYCDINEFLKIMKYDKIIDKKEKYLHFINQYNNNVFENTVSVMITELANLGDFLSFIRNNGHKLKSKQWKIFFFQLLSVLAIIQHQFPSFRHNDLKANNVLIDELPQESSQCYSINHKKYIIPKFKYSLKLWDFDFACIPGFVNNIKVCEKYFNKMNINTKSNRYYDIHFFFNTLISTNFYPDIMDPNLSGQDTVDFINRVIPPKYRYFKGSEYVNNKGRLLVNDEYTTPTSLLETDPYFNEFRKIEI